MKDRVSARRAAHHLLEHGVGVVAVAASDKGTLALVADGEHWLPRVRVKSIDATGAGDAFAAALGGALTEGRGFADACAFANSAAALATTIIGAQTAMPSRDAVEAVRKQTRLL